MFHAILNVNSPRHDTYKTRTNTHTPSTPCSQCFFHQSVFFPPLELLQLLLAGPRNWCMYLSFGFCQIVLGTIQMCCCALAFVRLPLLPVFQSVVILYLFFSVFFSFCPDSTLLRLLFHCQPAHLGAFMRGAPLKNC